MLVVFSFNATSSTAVWAGFTLDWYRELFQNELILGALWTTLAVSALAAVLSTVIGTAAAIGFQNLRRRFRSVCMTVNNIPLTNADIITGVSMMLLLLLAVEAWNGPLRTLLGESLPKLNLGFWSLAHCPHYLQCSLCHSVSCPPSSAQLDPNIY